VRLVNCSSRRPAGRASSGSSIRSSIHEKTERQATCWLARGLAAAITLAGAATISAQAPRPGQGGRAHEPPVKTTVASPQGYSVVLVLGDMQNASRPTRTCRRPRGRRWAT
jgi:hypothetical protein